MFILTGQKTVHISEKDHEKSMFTPLAHLIRLKPSRFPKSAIESEEVVIVNLVLRPPGGWIDYAATATRNIKPMLKNLLDEIEDFANSNHDISEVPVIICGGMGFFSDTGPYRYLLSQSDWSLMSAYQYYMPKNDDSNLRSTDFIFFSSSRLRPKRYLQFRHTRKPLSRKSEKMKVSNSTRSH